MRQEGQWSNSLNLTQNWRNALDQPRWSSAAGPAPPSITDENPSLDLLTDDISETQFHPLQLAGQRYFHTSHKIFEGIWLHTLIPEQELFKASRSIGKVVASTTVFVLLLSLSLMHYLLNIQVLEPIQQLRRAFLRIGEGEELAQALNLKVIAEGIEDQGQFAF